MEKRYKNSISLLLHWAAKINTGCIWQSFSLLSVVCVQWFRTTAFIG